MRSTRLPIVGKKRTEALKALSSDPLDTFPAFVDRVRERLVVGQRAYGDQSFSRPEGELIGEMKEELLDVCGWAYVLWTRLERLQKTEEQ